MPPVPLLPPSDVIKMFQRLGWQIVRQKGSHIIMTKPGHMATLSIPKTSRSGASGEKRRLPRSNRQPSGSQVGRRLNGETWGRPKRADRSSEIVL